MADEEEFNSFEDALDVDDYGLIISSTGELKGIFIPEQAKDQDNYIPESVVKIVSSALGVNIADMLDDHNNDNDKLH